MRKPLRTHDHAHLIALLRERRKAAGLTQQAVADRLGTPQSLVAKYEGGERRLDILEFIAIAEALGEKPEQLFARFVAERGTLPMLAGDSDE